ncbi:hypothetical protein FSARC_10803 [Fusarium sarcochroum]|uniref:Uncharacterized protein n=1 Tax=Fusarium sarcochroum TaxID=1208366 RepID=A0A8H4TJY7_9HYPO|nr:hypothetical protein FSARC_10803 [Fusarium sarcochroum]
MTISLDKSRLPQKSIQAVGDELLQLTNTLRTIALQRPSDPEAQRRARAAVDLYSGVPEFPPLTEPRQPEDNHEQRATVTFRLPLEIYSVIIGHVAAEYNQNPNFEERAGTLTALACSCRLFQALTEPYLYTYPRSSKLKKREGQWRFRFALAVEPRRATLVKALKINWHDEPSNSRLLINTARACPNVHRLKIVRRFLETDDAVVHKQQMDDLAELFDACPRVTVPSRRPFLQTRSEAHRGQDQRPNRMVPEEFVAMSSNLVSLTLEGEYDEEDIPELFTALCRQCPSMQNLDLRIILSTKSELIEACKKWGPTLRSFRLAFVQDLPNTIAQLIPFMPALEDIQVAAHLMHMGDAIKALAQTRLPPLRAFVCVQMARGIDDFSNQVTPELNTALADMITLHGPTLQCLGLGNDPRVDESVLKSLKKATDLRYIALGLPEDLEISVVKDVLDACPKLKHQFETGDAAYRRELKLDRILTVGNFEDRLRDPRSFSGSWAPEIRSHGLLSW